MNFRKLLLGISNSLVSSELEQLKYLCTEYIPEGEAERIEYGFKLFAALERRGELSEKNRDFLASLLGDIQRIDLKNKLLEIGAAAAAGQYINDSEVIDCHSDIVSDDGITKIKDSENENPSSAIDKDAAAAGQYINDSEVIDYGIIKITDSEYENPSSAIEKAAAAAGQCINDSEVIDCHSDIVSDDGIVKMKDSENEKPSSAIDKGDVEDSGLNDHQMELSEKFLFYVEQQMSRNELKDYLTYILNDHQMELSEKFSFNVEQQMSRNELKDYLTYILNDHQMELSEKFSLNVEQQMSPNELKDYLTFAKIFNSEEMKKLSKIIAKKVMSNSKVYQEVRRTKDASDKRGKVSLLKFFKNLLPNAQTTPLQDRGNTWEQQGMKRVT